MNLRTKLHKVLFTTAALVFGGALVAAPATAVGRPASEAAIAPATLPTAMASSSPFVAALAPDGSGVYDWTGGQSWTPIGGPAATLYAGYRVLLATAPGTGNVLYYSSGAWTQIGGAGAQFAIDGQRHVYALTPDKNAVMEWTGVGQSWIQIGGPASFIVGGTAGLIAAAPDTGNVMLFTGNGWTQIGGPGAQFAEDDQGNIYGLTPDKSAVMEWNGNQSWTPIGGPADSIVAGPAGLLATAPGTGNVMLFTGNGWTQIGGPGAQFAEDSNGDIYGLTPDKSAVMEWTGVGQSWTQIGGPASFIAAP
ncbi:hypothetical protein [Kitasatospora sp. MAP5-34]|uniref:hypothetical protein n=1 Tax=Kitasatospora sp. MAP5-34 TaxID=3035102 RepID=UPI002472F1A1|nr:hypothetical protein [Kitasatospora sp. MAP5-34]MDH6580626.1 hypothetical protein [Kitasatospora sp. MAP5-34]